MFINNRKKIFGDDYKELVKDLFCHGWALVSKIVNQYIKIQKKKERWFIRLLGKSHWIDKKSGFDFFNTKTHVSVNRLRVYVYVSYVLSMKLNYLM